MVNMSRQKPKPPKPPSPADAWQRATNEKCARAMALWLKETVNTQRPINTLKLEELVAMAENCVSAFIIELLRRPRDEMTKEERELYVALLSC